MNDNDTLADDLRKDSLALMKLLADEKHKSEALEAVIRTFLIWNGTDYTSDAARECALVEVVEDAYELVPCSVAETSAQRFSEVPK